MGDTPKVGTVTGMQDAGSHDPSDPPHVLVDAAALAVVVGELSKRYGSLDVETRSALAALTGSLNTMPPAPPAPHPTVSTYGDPRHEQTCTWTADVTNGTYRCTHGVVLHQHPRGWCDQGCCR